ncbi:GDSL-type esterase/lipase family protein [Fictibacillus sp. UD]|uniref:GDSL-type esterase/lipase family protein n=1 Tax=Fictibacillus sp. UD TaxID=3038777 RepID=UPI0037450396
MKLFKKPLAFFLSFFLLIFSLTPLTVSANSSKQSAINYVSLGDSLAAGITPYKSIGPGYPHYLTELLKSQGNVNPSYFGVPGYTSSDVIQDLTDPSRPNHNPMKKALRKAHIVTIDIGAIDVLAKMQAGQQITHADIKNTVNNVAKILVIIKTINPKAKVYVMGYYNPFPHPNSLYAPYVPTLLYALQQYNQSVEVIASFMNVTFVPTAHLVQANYVNYLPNPNDIHLSAEGYQAIADAFFNAIKSNQTSLVNK